MSLSEYPTIRPTEFNAVVNKWSRLPLQSTLSDDERRRIYNNLTLNELDEIMLLKTFQQIMKLVMDKDYLKAFGEMQNMLIATPENRVEMVALRSSLLHLEGGIYSQYSEDSEIQEDNPILESIRKNHALLNALNGYLKSDLTLGSVTNYNQRDIIDCVHRLPDKALNQVVDDKLKDKIPRPYMIGCSNLADFTLVFRNLGQQ